MMNKLRILVLIALGISLLFSLIKSILMRMPSANRTGAKKQLDTASWLDDKSREGALVKLTGVVRMRDHEKFIAPLSENRCVVLRLRAIVRQGRGPRGKLVEKTDVMPFVIEVDGAKVLVEASHALLDLAPNKLPASAETRKSKLLSELGHGNAQMSTSSCDETLVELGATVTVAGTLVTSPVTKIVGDANSPIAIRRERAHRDIASEP